MRLTFVNIMISLKLKMKKKKKKKYFFLIEIPCVFKRNVILSIDAVTAIINLVENNRGIDSAFLHKKIFLFFCCYELIDFYYLWETFWEIFLKNYEN